MNFVNITIQLDNINCINKASMIYNLFSGKWYFVYWIGSRRGRGSEIIPRIWPNWFRQTSEYVLRFFIICQRRKDVHRLATKSNQIFAFLRIATTCLLRPPFFNTYLDLYNINLPLNSDHLSTKAAKLEPQGWSLYTDLTERPNLVILLRL